MWGCLLLGHYEILYLRNRLEGGAKRGIYSKSKVVVVVVVAANAAAGAFSQQTRFNMMI